MFILAVGIYNSQVIQRRYTPRIIVPPSPKRMKTQISKITTHTNSSICIPACLSTGSLWPGTNELIRYAKMVHSRMRRIS